VVKSNKTIYVLLVVLLALFVYGVGSLFMLRFEAGDVYPAYSSRRADPLGAKAFYDSLENLQNISTSRNYRPLSKLRRGSEASMFYLGAHVEFLDFVHEDVLKAFDAWIESGGRLIVSFFPTKAQSSSHNSCRKNKRTDDGGVGEKRCTFVSLAEHWGIHCGFDEKLKDLEYAERAWSGSGAALPDSISWHTSLYFDGLDKPWRTIYARDGHPVIIERAFGKGTIVLAADSYLFSNEALRAERYPELLVWLLGASTNVIFDEAHLGIRENPGIAALARKYHLHGLLLGMLLLAGLFAWKNSFSFIPPRDEGPAIESRDFTSQRDYTAGFTSLLRRNISPRDILTLCFQEWKKSLPLSSEVVGNKLDRVQAVIDAQRAGPAKQRNPVQGFQTIQRILGDRN
jgi:hypothetical protein